MKRRVLVAQALVHKPPVIVLDEPTAGVDVELRQTLWQFIAPLNREGHTVLLTTHYLEEAEALCGRIAMLKSGRVVALDAHQQPAAAAPEHVLRFKLDGALPTDSRHGARRRAGSGICLLRDARNRACWRVNAPGRHARRRLEILQADLRGRLRAHDRDAPAGSPTVEDVFTDMHEASR